MRYVLCAVTLIKVPPHLKQLSHYFVGRAAYQKLHGLLIYKTLVHDIKKLSSDAQTSCLEWFHATLKHWDPR